MIPYPVKLPVSANHHTSSIPNGARRKDRGKGIFSSRLQELWPNGVDEWASGREWEGAGHYRLLCAFEAYMGENFTFL